MSCIYQYTQVSPICPPQPAIVHHSRILLFIPNAGTSSHFSIYSLRFPTFVVSLREHTDSVHHCFTGSSYLFTLMQCKTIHDTPTTRSIPFVGVVGVAGLVSGHREGRLTRAFLSVSLPAYFHFAFLAHLSPTPIELISSGAYSAQPRLGQCDRPSLQNPSVYSACGNFFTLALAHARFCFLLVCILFEHLLSLNWMAVLIYCYTVQGHTRYVDSEIGSFSGSCWQDF